ncbi:sigma-70 family RNA polymerase sigma factor [Bowmanella sp. JS7-9]|uniref:Sigma-70 family RNA polymerase sigma factor n=1 Tax=Pseudobowmanella zhangzhouensis TaxID=1537679 RepID=A0ABW1XM12_9ALTE|nr:sigma-70 family RNA polymerase sigma factor [Bowmanella sp. JS7-9]TBX27570.1 RNA polymerase sigma factor [Bowmanella sp. JS7-9]
MATQARHNVSDSHNLTPSEDNEQLCSWLEEIAATRSRSAFTHLFNWFAPKIRRVAARQFNNETQAMEVVQETMTHIWRKAHLFNREKGAATTWVYTVMRNVSYDMLRKMKNSRELPVSDDLWPSREPALDEVEVFDDHLEESQLLRLIESLPEAQQQVVRGVYFQDMSQEQLAIHLNIPLGTVKSRLRLALGKLRQQVQ